MKISMDYEWSLKLKPGKIVNFDIQGKIISLKLNPEVFLPHPDSLLLANSIKISKGERVIDLGLGTGILAITAAKLGASKVYGVDVNNNAIENSEENAILNNVNKKCFFKQGHWFRPFKNELFDCIMVNPPQIPGRGKTEENYFRQATEAGTDGIEPTIYLIKASEKCLNKNGRLYLVLKEWMDWRKVVSEMKKHFKCKVIANTFSPIWTKNKSRLRIVEGLVHKKKAFYRIIDKKRYYKIYAYECKKK